MYPCNNSYLNHVNLIGFKNQWNPHDPRRRCGQALGTTCPPSSNVGTISYGLNLMDKKMPGNLFRFYLPKGTTMSDLTLFGPPAAGACATISRIGSVPSFNSLPTDFNTFNDLAKYPKIFPPTQYPDVRSFWNGKKISQLKQYDWFAINQGGHITILVDSCTPLTEGCWLYIIFNSYDGSKIAQHAFTWYADEKIYTEWYDSFTGSWLANGDPPEYGV